MVGKCLTYANWGGKKHTFLHIFPCVCPLRNWWFLSPFKTWCCYVLLCILVCINCWYKICCGALISVLILLNFRALESSTGTTVHIVKVSGQTEQRYDSVWLDIQQSHCFCLCICMWIKWKEFIHCKNDMVTEFKTIMLLCRPLYNRQSFYYQRGTYTVSGHLLFILENTT